MTLEEYCNRTDSELNVVVVLNQSEYTKHLTRKEKGYWYSNIIIPLLEKQFGITDTYVQVNGNKQLWARHPETGKIHKLSVFHLPDDDNEPQEITQYREFNNENLKFINKWIEEHPNPKNFEDHNIEYKKRYSEFLHSVREKYNLTDEDIKFWLTF